MTSQTLVSPKWVARHLLVAAGILIIMGGVVVVAFRGTQSPILTWFMLLSLLLALIIVLSRAFTARWLGILIDERNTYSLSRLQMAMWTVIVLSGFMAAVLANVQLPILVYVDGAVQPQVLIYPVGTRILDVLELVGALQYDPDALRWIQTDPEIDLSQINISATVSDGQHIYIPHKGETVPLDETLARIEAENVDSTIPTTPLSVQIPSEVWVLLGISTTSLVATPLIDSQRSKQLQRNESPCEAKLSDFFTSEEITTYGQLDLGKVQLFLFTCVIIGAYGVALASVLNQGNTNATAITSLPALDGGVLAMLGVSHAGYLSNKAIPHPEGTPINSSATAQEPMIGLPYDNAPVTASDSDTTAAG